MLEHGIAASARCLSVAILLSLAACSRTPHALAERLSGLDIPPDAEVIEFIDQGMGPDLYVSVVLGLSEAAMSGLATEATSAGFLEIESLPLLSPDSESSFCSSATAAVWEALPRGSTGLYRFQAEDEYDCRLTLIDVTTKRVIVRLVIL